MGPYLARFLQILQDGARKGPFYLQDMSCDYWEEMVISGRLIVPTIYDTWKK